MKDRQQQKLLCILSVLLIGSLIPIISVTFCQRMVLDDFGYAAKSHNAWINTHSLLEMLKVSMENVKTFWYGWQGSIVSNFMFSFNAASFAEKYYWMNSLFIMSVFCFSAYYLTATVIRKCLKLEKYDSFLFLFFLLLLSFNFLPSAAEGFYFFNDAGNYTFFYSMICIHVALLINGLVIKKNHYVVLSCVTGFLTAGGHLSMGVFSLVISACFVLYCAVVNKKQAVRVVIPAVFVLLSLLINALAPGYQVRSAESYGLSIPNAIVMSFVQAFKELNNFTRIETIPFTLIILVLLTKMPETAVAKLKHPILLTLLVIGVYATQFTAALYGVGYAEFLRQRNIAYFSYFWLLSVLAYIWIAYYRTKGFTFHLNYQSIPQFPLVCVSLLVFGVLGTGNLNSITAISAARSLISGEAQSYKEERDTWIRTIEESDSTAAIKPITHKVDVVDPWGVLEVDTEWVLDTMAGYYGIDKVVLLDE